MEYLKLKFNCRIFLEKKFLNQIAVFICPNKMNFFKRSSQISTTPQRKNQGPSGQGQRGPPSESSSFNRGYAPGQTPKYVKPPSVAGQQKAAQDDDGIDIEDIDLQNKSEEDMESSDSAVESPALEQNFSKPKPRGGPGRSSVAQAPLKKPGFGSNETPPHRKSISNTQQRSAERRERISFARKPSPRSRGGRGPKVDEVDAPVRLSFAGSADLEVKQALLQIDESQRLLDLVKKFQSSFTESQQKMNSCDMSMIEQNMFAKALKMQYKIIEDAHGNESFDRQNLGKQVLKSLEQNQRTSEGYRKFKGELLAVHEPIINKDLLLLKLDKVQRYSEKQKLITKDFAAQEQAIRVNNEQISRVRESYAQFEQGLFDGKISATKAIVKDADEVLRQIQEKLPVMKESIEASKKSVDSLVPVTPEQRQEQHDIYSQLVDLEKEVATAGRLADSQQKERDDFATKHEACLKSHQKYSSQLPETPKAVAESIQQSRELRQFIENHIEWQELYERLKIIKDDQVDPMSSRVLGLQDRTEKLSQQLDETKTHELETLAKDIEALHKKVASSLEEESSRLTTFEETVNTAKERGLSKLTDDNLLFINIEVMRCRSSIETCKATVDAIWDDSESFLKEARKKKEVDLEDSLLLKQNYKALQRQDTVDVPRIQRNIDQLSAYTSKATKGNLNEAQKKSQMMISKMKKASDSLQQAIEALNQNIQNERDYLDNLDAYFKIEDLERDNEITYSLEDKLNECDQDVNAEDDSLSVTHKLIVSAINKIVNRFNENNKAIKESSKAPKSEEEMNELIEKNQEIQTECEKGNTAIEQAFVEVREVQERLDQLGGQGIKEKYDAKSKTAGECERLYLSASEKSQTLEQLLATQIGRVSSTIDKLEAFKPASSTSASVDGTAKLQATIQEHLAKLSQHLDELQEIEATSYNLEDMEEIMEPVNELGKREVKHKQLLQAQALLEKVLADLLKNEKLLYDKKMRSTEELCKAAEKVIFDERRRKQEEARAKIQQLGKGADQVEVEKNYCVLKLQELRHTLDEINQVGKDDPVLQNKVNQTELNCTLVERELGGVDQQIGGVRKRRAECQSYLSLIESKPEKFSFPQIEETIGVLSSERAVVDQQSALLSSTKSKLDGLCLEYSITCKALQQEKDAEFDAANAQLLLLYKNIDNLEAEKSYCDIRLAEVRQIVSNIDSMGKNDPQLQQKLDQSKVEYDKIQVQLEEAERQIKDLKSKRDDCKEFTSQYERAPNKHSMVQIQQTIKIAQQANSAADRQYSSLIRIKEYLDAQSLEYKALLLSLGDEKGAKVIEINSQLELLESKVEDLQEKRNTCALKLKECQGLMATLKGSGKTESALGALIKKHELELSDIEKELGRIDGQILTLNKKKAESKKFVAEVNANPSKFTLLDIDAQLTSINEQISAVDSHREQLNRIEARLDAKINDLKELIGSLDNEKSTLIMQADKNQNLLGGKIVELERKRKVCQTKLEEVESLMGRAQAFGTLDVQLKGKKVKLDEEIRVITQDLVGIDATIAELKVKEGSNKRQMAEIKANPEKATFETIRAYSQEVLSHVETSEQALVKLEKIEEKLDAKLVEIKALNRQLEELRGKQLGECDKKLGLLLKSVGELEDKKASCDDKHSELVGLLAVAKQQKKDPALERQVTAVEREANGASKELGVLGNELRQLQQREPGFQGTLSSMKSKPDQFSEGQITDLAKQLDAQNRSAEDGKVQLTTLEEKLDEQLAKLRAFTEESDARLKILAQINSDMGALRQSVETFGAMFEPLFKKMRLMLLTVEEMKQDMGPDKSADYWEEKKEILQFEADIGKLHRQLEQTQGRYRELEQKAEAVDQDLEASKADLAALERIQTDQLDLSHLIEESLNEGLEVQKRVKAQKTSMGECWLPTNISLRSSEIKAYSERLDRLVGEFNDLKKADDEYEGDHTSEAELRRLRNQIEPKVKQAEQDLFEMTEAQGRLEAFGHSDFISYENQKLIAEVRRHKKDIQERLQRLSAIAELNEALNQALLKQSIHNAYYILSQKTQKLRERLKASQASFEKVVAVGEDMDENTSTVDEAELIEELQEGQPEVEKNIREQFERIEQVEQDIKLIGQTQSVADMQAAQKEIDEATKNIEKLEFFVQNLDSEIIEWGPPTKLAKRDKELFRVKDALGDYPEKADEEMITMDEKLKEKTAKLAKEKEHKAVLESHIEGINHYMEELKELREDAQTLLEDRDARFEKFNADLPASVKQDRVDRFSAVGYEAEDFELDATSDKPKDHYYMLKINCKHKQPIKALCEDLDELLVRIAAFEDKYAILKQKLENWAPPKLYKAVKGDEVDALFAYHFNKAQLALPVKRLGPGKYMFGSKQILAKIVNGKLLIRVGGGYCGVDEFIEQYGPMEMLKIMHAERAAAGGDKHSHANQKAIARDMQNIKDMRESMRENMRASLLSNVKSYTETDGGQKDSVAKQGQNIDDVMAQNQVQAVGALSPVVHKGAPGKGRSRKGDGMLSPPTLRNKALPTDSSSTAFDHKDDSPRRGRK